MESASSHAGRSLGNLLMDGDTLLPHALNNRKNHFAWKVFWWVDAFCEEFMFPPRQSTRRRHQSGGAGHARITVFSMVLNGPDVLNTLSFNSNLHPSELGPLRVKSPRLHKFIRCLGGGLVAFDVSWPSQVPSWSTHQPRFWRGACTRR